VVIDDENKPRTLYVSNSDLMNFQAAPWVQNLTYEGWVGVPDYGARTLVAKFMLEYRTGKLLRLVDTGGWHGDIYVPPGGEVIGAIEGEREQPFLHPAPEAKFQTGGSLEGWKGSIGLWAVGNSRLILAICAALAAFLLRYRREAESFGVHFHGVSSQGKTTVAQAAASLCGLGSVSGGYIGSWRATENALAGLAAQHNDAPMFLDETGLTDAKTLYKATYGIAEGKDKDRLDRDAKLKRTKKWRVTFISTGEKALAGKLAEAGLDPQGGQAVRFLNIPAPENSDYGFFEDIHDFESANAFANAIKQAAVSHYGHIAPAFIARLIETGHAEIEARLKEYLNKNIGKLCGEDADGQVKRVAGHFLLCAFAGRLATEWGLLPWETNDAFRAAKKCYRGWLATRGTTGAMEDKALIDRVRLFITEHGDSRFQNLDGDESKSFLVRDRAGFKFVEKSGKLLYLFTKEIFQKEICKGLDPTRAAAVLHQHGMLKRDSAGYMIKPSRKLPDVGRARCFAILLPDKNE